jgi:hypothetical protein
MSYLVVGQHLPDVSIRLGAPTHCGQELPVLKLDTVHGHIDVRDVNLLLVAVDQIVVSRDVGPAAIWNV